ncbi:pyridoxal 5'-phosphate synthase glutaminase subunit PdxT [Anaerolineales bacterium]
MRVGILALQGAFIEHKKIIETLGYEAPEIRKAAQLDDLDGLIIPGGESTTIGKLATDYGLIDPLKTFGQEKAVWGTCAGMIFLAKKIGIADQPILGLMDIEVERNAFGRQVDSFETELSITGLESGFEGIFIRAPKVKAVGPAVEVLSRLADGTMVAVKEGHLLATSFHPELTKDMRFHQLFCDMIMLR